MIRQDIPECHTPEPGGKLGTACDRNVDDPAVPAMHVKVFPCDLSQDVWIVVNTKREIKSHGLSWMRVGFLAASRSNALPRHDRNLPRLDRNIGGAKKREAIACKGYQIIIR